MFQNFCHVFNFDCGFTHVSHIWPDIVICYLLYQLGTGGCTQKAEPVRGVYP